ncbi:MAG: hypothetical protein ACM3ZC_02075, partial [Bacteroidota bacterium]
FIDFLYLLSKDFENNQDEWENRSIGEYLEGIQGWVEDMEGYYKNSNLPVPQDINWYFIALVFYVGKIYA